MPVKGEQNYSDNYREGMFSNSVGIEHLHCYLGNPSCMRCRNQMKFRHYLLGRKFHLITDHAQLQWLSSQKMEGMLCQWALVIQEFDFDISYRNGSLNSNADALSSRDQPSPATTALTTTIEPLVNLVQCQQNDPVTKKLYDTLLSYSTPSGKSWKQSPFHWYRQIWSQLKLVDGALCRHYLPDPTFTMITVPVLPESLQQTALNGCHADPSGGHLG